MNAKTANGFLGRFGVQLKKTNALATEREHYSTIINGALKIFDTHKKYEGRALNSELAGLVFSKDRAMQLHALLKSYDDNVKGLCPLTVLYKATSEQHQRSYEGLKTEFQNRPVEFLEETNFNHQVKSWLAAQNADRIFFMTDDAVFLDTFDMADALLFNPLNEIFSLTKGHDLRYCFTMDVKQELPFFLDTHISGKSLNSWVWGNCLDSPDWSYPLSVDGCFYLREEMLGIADHIAFNNPNSLEANMQLYKSFFLQRKGVCYDKVKLVNVPCNLVQNDFKNRSTGYFDAAELLQLWEEGKRIKTENFYGLTAFDAAYAKYDFYKMEIV